MSRRAEAACRARIASRTKIASVTGSSQSSSFDHSATCWSTEFRIGTSRVVFLWIVFRITTIPP